MKKYEVGFIIKPNIDDTKIKDLIEKLKNIYTTYECNIVDEFDMGLRTMAYDMEKSNTGYYYFLNVEATHEANQEFERISRISEELVRFMIIDVDDIEGSTLDILR